MVVGDSAIFYMVIRGSVLVFERGKERDELGMKGREEIGRGCHFESRIYCFESKLGRKGR